MKKRVECECGWVLETDDEDKLVAGVKQHASEVHHMEGVTREQVLAQAKERFKGSQVRFPRRHPPQSCSSVVATAAQVAGVGAVPSRQLRDKP